MSLDTGGNIVELLLNKSSKAVERLKLDLDLKLKRVYPKILKINVNNLIKKIEIS